MNVLKCFIPTICTYCTFWFCPKINDIYDNHCFFFDVSIISLIFINMQIGNNNTRCIYMYFNTDLIQQETRQISLINNSFTFTTLTFQDIKGFVLANFYVRNGRLLWERNLSYLWCIHWLQDKFILSRTVLRCFLSIVFTFYAPWPYQRINEKLIRVSFFRVSMFSLIFTKSFMFQVKSAVMLQG